MQADALLSIPMSLVSVSKVATLGVETDAVIAIALWTKSAFLQSHGFLYAIPWFPEVFLCLRFGLRFVVVIVSAIAIII